MHESSTLERNLDDGWCNWTARRRRGRKPASGRHQPCCESNKRRRDDAGGFPDAATTSEEQRRLCASVNGMVTMARLCQRRLPAGFGRPVRPGISRRNILCRPVGGSAEWTESAGRTVERFDPWRSRLPRLSSRRDVERNAGRRTSWFQYSGRTSQSGHFF